jgi:hypothetical protein
MYSGVLMRMSQQGWVHQMEIIMLEYLINLFLGDNGRGMPRSG